MKTFLYNRIWKRFERMLINFYCQSEKPAKIRREGDGLKYSNNSCFQLATFAVLFLAELHN